MIGDRVWLIGPSGGGKSTLARELAEARGVPHHELDALFWGPGWERRPEPDFLADVAKLDAEPRWVVDGQYDMAHPVMEKLADTVIWVDPPRPTTAIRLVRRTWARLRSREELWNGNKERLSGALQLLTWAHNEFPKVRRTNAALADRLTARGVPVLRLRTVHEVDELLRKERR